MVHNVESDLGNLCVHRTHADFLSNDTRETKKFFPCTILSFKKRFVLC